MTTIVTVKTHGWPVSVTMSSSHSHSDNQRSSYGHSSTTEFVPKGVEKDFSVSSGCYVTVQEMAADATGLDVPVAAELNSAQAAAG